ncbi:MAG: hypothetical protein ACKV2V_06115, partial [Blastocatellia bacterium]
MSSARMIASAPGVILSGPVAETVPAIDRLLETGKERAAILSAIAEGVRRQDLPPEEVRERESMAGFLRDYIDERLRDPETRALNQSPAFRAAHERLSETRTPADLNREAELFLRENLARGEQQRLHQLDPARHPLPDTPPLNPAERNLLFHGRAAEQHTAEMRELRYTWGESRAQRTARVQDLREGRLAPSDTLQRMLEELGERRTEAAVRHYQAALLNDELRNPGRVNLREMYTRIAPHERTFLIEQANERKQDIARAQTPPKDTHERAPENNTARAISATPRESAVYREYLAEMGSAELRLLNEAVRQRQRLAGYFVRDR